MATALLVGQLTWNIPMLWIVLGIGAAFVWMLRSHTDIRVLRAQPLLLLLSLALFYLTMGSPLTALSHLSFSVHMIQMSVLYFIIPPLFLLGIPNQLFQKLQNLPQCAILARLFPKPKWSLLLFSCLLLVYHLPIVLNALALNPIVHNGYMIALTLFALSMWWPFAAPNPALRFEQKRKKRYAAWCGALLTPACALFVVSALFDNSSHPFLAQLTAELCGPSIDLAALVDSPIHPKMDQMMAGFFMLGIHKSALMIAYRIDRTNNKQD